MAGGAGCPASVWGVWRLLEAMTTEAVFSSGVMGSSGGCGRLPAPKAGAGAPVPLNFSQMEHPTCPKPAFPSPADDSQTLCSSATGFLTFQVGT